MPLKTTCWIAMKYCTNIYLFFRLECCLLTVQPASGEILSLSNPLLSEQTFQTNRILSAQFQCLTEVQGQLQTQVCIRNDLNHKNMNLICRYILYVFEFSYYILIYLKWLNHCRCCNTCRIEDKLNYVNTL